MILVIPSDVELVCVFTLEIGGKYYKLGPDILKYKQILSLALFSSYL